MTWDGLFSAFVAGFWGSLTYLKTKSKQLPSEENTFEPLAGKASRVEAKVLSTFVPELLKEALCFLVIFGEGCSRPSPCGFW